MLDKGEYQYLSAATKAQVEPSTSMDSTLTTTRKNKKNKNKNKNKRKFSDEQIRSMETMFESESKLEPQAKLQLAKQLDLQPRQVAIWFQNRRARWKSKQLEKDYNILKASYDALASQFECLKKEKQVLHAQLQKLNDRRQEPKGERSLRPRTIGLDGSSTYGESDNGIAKYEPEQKPALSFKGPDFRVAPSSDDEKNHNIYLGEEEDTDLMSVMDPNNPILTSPANWDAFDSGNSLLDQSGGTLQWWEFWA